MSWAIPVSLFVRLWVEIFRNRNKYSGRNSQPLREAVSWNDVNIKTAKDNLVSLFVRLWVEMIYKKYKTKQEKSASSWGCELKFRNGHWHAMDHRQPLREAVSWNNGLSATGVNQVVSLFVRLWVEMQQINMHSHWPLVSLFVRLWVEMISCLGFPSSSRVSLFVRLWVEMEQMKLWNFPDPVSLFVRLWVEMTLVMKKMPGSMRQPLREAVSWNINEMCFSIRYNCQPLREAVSWNFCKKCNRIYFFASFFIRLWIGRKQR